VSDHASARARSKNDRRVHGSHARASWLVCIMVVARVFRREALQNVGSEYEAALCEPLRPMMALSSRRTGVAGKKVLLDTCSTQALASVAFNEIRGEYVWSLEEQGAEHLCGS
jgi:hypothetical protein